MTEEQALIELKELQKETQDIYTAHHRADEIMCELLVSLGKKDVVCEYNKVEKWYE